MYAFFILFSRTIFHVIITKGLLCFVAIQLQSSVFFFALAMILLRSNAFYLETLYKALTVENTLNPSVLRTKENPLQLCRQPLRARHKLLVGFEKESKGYKSLSKVWRPCKHMKPLRLLVDDAFISKEGASETWQTRLVSFSVPLLLRWCIMRRDPISRLALVFRYFSVNCKARLQACCFRSCSSCAATEATTFQKYNENLLQQHYGRFQKLDTTTLGNIGYTLLHLYNAYFLFTSFNNDVASVY